MNSEYSNSEPIKLSKYLYTILCHLIIWHICAGCSIPQVFHDILCGTEHPYGTHDIPHGTEHTLYRVLTAYNFLELYSNNPNIATSNFEDQVTVGSYLVITNLNISLLGS